MKQYLSSVVQGYGYKNVKEFLAEYKASKVEYGDYRKAVAEWEKLTGEKVDDSLKAKLQQKQQQVKEQYRHTEYHKKNDRGGKVVSEVEWETAPLLYCREHKKSVEKLYIS